MDGFKKIKKLNQKKAEKQFKLTQLSRVKSIKTNSQQLTYSVLQPSSFKKQRKSIDNDQKEKDQIENRTFVIKNLDENKVQFINSEEQTNHIISNLNQIPQIQALIHSLWEKYLNDYEKEQQQFLEACYQGSTNIVKKVLRSQNPHPIDPRKALTIEGKNGIHLATLSGSYKNIAIIQLLAQYNIDINGITAYQQRTPLMLSAIIGNDLACQALLKLGANTSLTDKEGNTALHYAYHFNRENIIYMLLEYKDLTDIKNKQGKIPQQCCLIKPKFNQSVHTNNSTSEKPETKEMDYQVQKCLNQLSGKTTTKVNPKVDRKSDKIVKGQTFQEIMRDIKIKQSAGLQNFKKISLLGKGAFGSVYLAKNQDDGKQYAIKTLQKSMIMKQNILRYAMTERKILSTINHPFVIKLHYAFQNNENLFLVMDYCPGGDLLNMIKRNGTLDQKTLRLYVCQLVLALDQLHKAEIIYRDLKPGNVVFTKDGHACLTDFGLSKQAQLTNSFCGSTAYLAPQMLWRKGHTKILDWYLLGVLIYECLTGKPPFWNTNKQVLLSNIRSGRFKPLGQSFSPQINDLVKNLLNNNSRKRLGVNGTKQIQNHAWFKGVNWDDVYYKRIQMPPIVQIKGKPIKDSSFQKDLDNQNIIEGWQFKKSS